MNKLLLYFNTLKYLKLKQFGYRLFYKLRSLFRKITGFSYKLTKESRAYEIKFKNSIVNKDILFNKYTFIFLNKKHDFNENIEWNYNINGKLWTYNLTYFDFLCQENIDKKTGLNLIHSFISQIRNIKDGLEPFPISLRGMNWIKFLVKYKIEEKKINDSLNAQYTILLDNLEYHLLGNHLLENGFSLLYAAYYFHDENFYRKAKMILIDELEEQILQDGAHFELSPMYHQIMLYRVLECINLVQNNRWKDQALLELLIEKAQVMLGWLNIITYENGNIPLLNDSANNIAPTTKELNEYASTLNIKTKEIRLNESGYRKIKNERYEMVIDVGNIGPNYIPGHAHSDTFNFELYIHDQPVILDTGLSTYEANEIRQLERSTQSHNTVIVDGDNQSQVWGGFRVARRAKIIDLKESINCVKATHDGYKDKGVWHTRKFMTEKDHIIIKDHLKSNKEHSCVAYLHFHPDIKLYIESEKLIGELFTISFVNSHSIKLIDYDYSPEFNTKINAKCVIISFQKELTIKVEIKDIL